MVERIKRGCLAIGVCFPIYLALYGAVYVIERLWLPDDQWFAGPALLGVGVVLALRLAWLFGRAALRGGPVLQAPQEPDVIAPILPIVSDPARPVSGVQAPAAVRASAAGGAPAAHRRQPAAAGRLVPDVQHG